MKYNMAILDRIDCAAIFLPGLSTKRKAAK
jgi:hypothetical protein